MWPFKKRKKKVIWMPDSSYDEMYKRLGKPLARLIEFLLTGK